MGAIAGIMEAQYNILRKKGHAPSEAFNETDYREKLGEELKTMRESEMWKAGAKGKRT
ncbi:hypothetical protein COS77_03410 [Candidatus Roizmanbacteria bacterium CG06_land_8_20_14_3_00_34_14]|uniref:Ketol-acid reductoisomerase n=2 Tax=Candidatus Roizmaniibacteriota TaxID=1752723 RepID=A0A2M7ATX9_9BACT|nr:MAG: hypothetical protein COT02_01810 [Candidatus Roizmanbacteria bacterium CG07_land_8_20_14_0_80_34_15]PIU74084.1 MAG: hypothetical protein COS77_03410 [Candidatus Roizmanbacteria bacterium CG06_land_8_20_14_3_00_34_14]